MGKRLRLGLVYLWDQKWWGGVYYTQNLLKALDTLEEDKKPLVHLYCLNDKAFDDMKRDTSYPYLEKAIVKFVLWKRILRKVANLFSPIRASRINILGFSEDNDDIIYPWYSGSNKKMLFWMPDFQTKYLPELFNKKEIREREQDIVNCCKRKIPIVFSSYDAQHDFIKFYPKFKKHSTFVVHFATSLLDFSGVDMGFIKQKYGINRRYFLCPNQFWQHKNHLLLFKAIKKTQEKGLDIQLVCTGKMSDYRHPEYITVLKDFISLNHLDHHILTLGMIDKKDLYCLMKNSYAVIQPSLFEGWNTTVEDCKAMRKFVFLSNIKVHQEQMQMCKNVCFFDPYDENDLANKLLTVRPIEEFYDYSKNVENFGMDFYNVLNVIGSGAR